jgi:hypothetical protein
MHPSRTFVPLALLAVSLCGVAALAQGPARDVAAPPEPARDTELPSSTTSSGDAPPVRREERGPRLTRLDELVVEADQPLSAASSQVIRTRDYALRPHSTTQEILNNVPGLTVVQHQGGGKAVQYLIRGFDADHGTDFALFTDGIPVNLVTHGHGQGYADLNYLIPETVDDLQLFKGPYFVELGDFSLAGALKITTKDEFHENFALAEGGSFDTQRYVLGGSLPVTWGKTLLAAEVYNSNGPFDHPQNYWRYNGFGKVTITQAPDQKLQFLGSIYSGDWDGSGQIPARVVGDQPGDISRFGSLDPSEGGHTDRENLSMLWHYQPDADTTWDAQLWGSRYHLRLFSDFTFFQNTGLRFYTLPGSARIIDRCAGLGPSCPLAPPASIPNAQFVPGDGIEQTDTRLLFGGFVQYGRFYTLNRVPWLGDLPMRSEFGLATRRDQIDVSLRNQVRRRPYFTINDVGVGEQSVSGWCGQQIFLTDWARLEGGVRGDVYFFNVGNQLPQQGLDPNFQAVFIDGTNVKGLPSPKVNLVLGPWYNTEYYLNFGYGFHSNDARSVILTGTDGLAQGYGYEAGVRTRQLDRLDVAAAIWLLDLDSELVFSGDAGNVDQDLATGAFIPGPPTRRYGVDFETRYQFTDWLFADYDLTFASPHFRSEVCVPDLGSPTGQDCGTDIPLAPRLVMNGGLTAEFSRGWAAGLGAALRFRYLGSRPANEQNTLTAQGWTLLDLLLRYRWRNVEASLALTNLTDTAWREAQFAESTCVNQRDGLDYGSPPGTGQPCPVQGSRPAMNTYADGIDGVSFTPGNPFGARGGLQIFF